MASLLQHDRRGCCAEGSDIGRCSRYTADRRSVMIMRVCGAIVPHAEICAPMAVPGFKMLEEGVSSGGQV